MSPKQQRFVEEYMADLNATQAAVRAGYSPKTAAEQGSRLLTNVNVSDAVSRMTAEQSRRTGVTADRIIREMAKIAFANIADVANLDEATARGGAAEEDTAAVQSVKVKRIQTDGGEIVEREVKLHDKVRALTELGKHVGLFDTRVKVSGAATVVIRDDLGPGNEDDGQ